MVSSSRKKLREFYFIASFLFGLCAPSTTDDGNIVTCAIFNGNSSIEQEDDASIKCSPEVCYNDKA